MKKFQFIRRFSSTIVNKKQSRDFDDAMRQLLRRGERRLIEQGRLDARTAKRDAESLLAHCAGFESRNDMFVNADMHLDGVLQSAELVQRFERCLRRRAQREPLQYIVGHCEFYGLKFELWPGQTLIPRSDTEVLVDAALELIVVEGDDKKTRDNKRDLVLCDVGTGTGCILLSLLKQLNSKHVKGIGLDVSANAVVVATRNALRHDLFAQTRFLTSNWLQNVPLSLKKNPNVLILCNPPYVELDADLEPELSFEPARALFGTPRNTLAPFLSSVNHKAHRQARILLEIGANQLEETEMVANDLQWQVKNVWNDLQAVERVLLLERATDGDTID